MELEDCIAKVAQGVDLTEQQSVDVADLLASADVEAGLKADFLTRLAIKGESSQEVAGLAKRYRQLARDPELSEWSDSAIDVCGTGGDKQHTFNISTTVTFVVAAAGIPVLKHGNRSITSQCGSSNLLEAIGIDITADNGLLKRSMRELGFCFMFAPAFHPAFKEIVPVRQALAKKGQRTVFNILGPLINPAKPAHQLLGVFSESVMELMAEAEQSLGLKAGLIAHCDMGPEGGMDEFSVAGSNLARGFGSLNGLYERWSPEQMGVKRGMLSDLKGGDVAENIGILDRLLDGAAPKALEDSVAINAAAAFYIVGRHESIREGVAEARELLLGGSVRQKIDQAKEFYRS
ncbi:MAG TPA: anthranilate phosphoribosyltransferase [Opitutae bacterium]|nr:anthranilate phosphoribosyltransferase [Myxococcales bacterium]HCR28935.1 anthranilate phosphoribosyltransferase [Opitutae bacterium]